MKLAIFMLLAAQAITLAQDVFLGIPPAKNAKPDLTKFEGILDAKLLTEPIRPVDVAAKPDAWKDKFLDKYDGDVLFNVASYVKVMDDRMLMLGSRHPKTSRAKVLACITEMFRLFGPPTKFLTDDPDDDTYQDYLGFVWAGDGAHVLLAFHTGENFPWEGILMASGGADKPERAIEGEANGSKEIPRPADVKGTITTWLKKIENE